MQIAFLEYVSDFPKGQNAYIFQLAPKDDDERPGLAEAGVVLLSKTHGQTIRYPNADDVDFQKVSEVLTAIVAEVARRGNQYRS